MITRKVVVAISIFVLLATASFHVFSKNSPSNRFTSGVVPQFEASKLIAIWQPIFDEIEGRAMLARISVKRVESATTQDYLYLEKYDD